MEKLSPAETSAATPTLRRAWQTAFGCPRDFLDNRFVYVVISPRARGLSVGVNMVPDKSCNFDCLYCEVNRAIPSRESKLDINAMSAELQRTLALVRSGEIRHHPLYASLPEDLLKLRHVALSGDGEPTQSPLFVEAVEAVVHVRALSGPDFFKIVLLTNGSGLDLPQVQSGLELLTLRDEIWIKLDAGTQAYMDKINRPQGVTLEKILANILLVSRQRPVIIQTLFPMLNGQEPPPAEITAYSERLNELVRAGARIAGVQIYSATRPAPHSECGHLPLRNLSRIVQTVRTSTGLKVELF